MRRLLRWAFKLSAIVSAVLLVGVCVLWVRSYRTEDCYFLPHGRQLIFVEAERAVLRFGWDTSFSHPAWGWATQGSRRVHYNFGRTWGWDGVEGFHQDIGGMTFRNVTIHMAYAALLTTLPAFAGFRFVTRRKRRGTPGHCPQCGYDLRATPHRCPERGAVPKGEKPA